MLCAMLDWKYAEFPSSASEAVLCICLYVRCVSSNEERKKIKEKVFCKEE